MRRTIAAFVLALSLLGLSCAQDETERTELIVVVDSDLKVPSELDSIEIHAQGPGDTKHEASAALGSDEPGLPRTLTLVHRGGALGPISIEVDGLQRDKSVLVRSAEVSFARGRSLVLPLHLVRRCRDVECGAGETCTERGCESSELDEGDLEPWSGDKPQLMDAGWVEEDAGEADAGVMDASTQDAGAKDAGARDSGTVRDAGTDASACSGQRELCNKRDDNCNGQVDEGFNLQNDENNCGMCGVRCNAGQLCCGGSCKAPSSTCH